MGPSTNPVGQWRNKNLQAFKKKIFFQLHSHSQRNSRHNNILFLVCSLGKTYF